MNKKIKDCVLIESFKCNENDNLVDVANKLKEITLRHIFVVNNEETPVGIISVIDMNNRVIAEGKNPKDLTAKDIMSKIEEIADVEDDVKEFCDKACEKQRVLSPVVKDNKMVGIVTLHQLIKNIQ